MTPLDFVKFVIFWLPDWQKKKVEILKSSIVTVNKKTQPWILTLTKRYFSDFHEFGTTFLKIPTIREHRLLRQN